MSTTSKQSGQPSTVNTSCKECSFAVYKDITQVSCKANILDKYKTKGNVIEAYDEQKEFYVIKDIVCPYYRGPSWAHNNKPISFQLEKARAELTMNYDVVIVVENFRTAPKLETTIKNLMMQTKKPSKVTCLIPDPIVTIDKWIMKQCEVPWTIEQRIDRECGLDRNHMRNILRKTKSPLICYLKSGTTFEDKNLFQLLENKIIDNQFAFSLIKISDSEFITPRICYEYFNFIAESSIHTIYDAVTENEVFDICHLK